ncbi:MULTISPECIES: MarR family winged helix-turn-helix transcriptional regulator [Frankiaceae]|uniref:MarR family winged helix-turn-helix transcriptional regulator n=1 Tax=Frankiaceae TaxID=74712 RepID=UPI000A915D06|nr:MULTISPECIES: MarR family transcriptional regulator [Frankiaceae]MBE3203439.1 MarR family transcriptional regulator [Parafrankia sp. CH37]
MTIETREDAVNQRYPGPRRPAEETDPGRARPVADLSTHPGQLARRLQQVTYQLWTAVVSTETTPPQFVVLNSLLADPDIDQRTLGERASLDRSTVADVVARLVQRGLIRRVRDPRDGRRNVLRLTQRGEATHSQVASRVERMNDLLLSPLNTDERTALRSMLTRIIESVPAISAAEGTAAV